MDYQKKYLKYKKKYLELKNGGAKKTKKEKPLRKCPKKPLKEFTKSLFGKKKPVEITATKLYNYFNKCLDGERSNLAELAKKHGIGYKDLLKAKFAVRTLVKEGLMTVEEVLKEDMFSYQQLVEFEISTAKSLILNYNIDHNEFIKVEPDYVSDNELLDFSKFLDEDFKFNKKSLEVFRKLVNAKYKKIAENYHDGTTEKGKNIFEHILKETYKNMEMLRNSGFTVSSTNNNTVDKNILNNWANYTNQFDKDKKEDQNFDLFKNITISKN